MNMLSETLKLNISVESLGSGMDNKCYVYKSLNKENGQKGIGFSSFRMEGVLRKFRYMYRRGVFRITRRFAVSSHKKRKRWREGLEISFAYKETNKKEKRNGARKCSASSDRVPMVLEGLRKFRGNDLLFLSL